MTHLRRAALTAAALGALALSTLPAWGAPAAARPLKLFTPTKDVLLTVHHAGDDTWTEFNPTLYLESLRDVFEIDVRRPKPNAELEATVLVGGKRHALPASLLDGWSGLKNAFVLTWRSTDGTTLSRTRQSWCPNEGTASRLRPHAATSTRFTYGCSSHPFTISQRWGIDRGWARQVLAYGITPPEGTLPEHLTLEVSLRAGLGKALGIPESNRSLTFAVTTKDVIDDDGAGPEPGPADAGAAPAARAAASRHAHDEPTTSDPKKDRHFSEAVLPDLVSLPAYGISTHFEEGRDQLDFAATVYNGGRGPLVAEGFRRGSKEVMKAYQFFYRHGDQVASAPVGSMEYDRRESHQHWHFRDFAVYDLVNADHHRLRTSGKEAFCLAPTDAINLLQPGAVVSPGNGDLSTACGDASSVWVREVLASGWGDTYTQARAGQSIDITGLANGTYWIRVTANPGDRLYEKTRKNNVSLRKVVLGGTPGARTVSVPRYGVIDSETGTATGPF